MATDLDWLACVITRLDVDVLAVQEWKTYPRAVAATANLVASLDRLTGGRWRSALDDCQNVAGQHVGFLYDAARVEVRGFMTHAGLNPHGIACQDQLRPGFGGYFRFPGGLDLHLISVHLKSGSERRSLGLRQRSLQALPAARDEAQARLFDGDVVFVGDFNTMGCARCSPKLTAQDELDGFSALLSSLGLRPVESVLACTHYYRGQPGRLDHFVIPRALAELPSGGRVEVSGHCGELGCAPFRDEPAADRRLSDHCPIVLELDDVDRD